MPERKASKVIRDNKGIMKDFSEKSSVVLNYIPSKLMAKASKNFKKINSSLTVSDQVINVLLEAFHIIGYENQTSLTIC